MAKSILTLRLIFFKTNIEQKKIKWLLDINMEDMFISTSFALI